HDSSTSAFFFNAPRPPDIYTLSLHDALPILRIRTTYPFRTLLDTGAKLAFGSDWTVAPLDPILGVYAAVTRRTLDGKNPNGWVPEQKVSVGEALRAYTAGNAYATFDEGKRGTL